MKVAANVSLLFTDRPLVERVVAARVAGFEGVEVHFPYELPAIRMKEALEAAGLPLILFNVPAGDVPEGGAGLAAVPERQAAFDEALERALSYAAMTRPRFVSVLAGRQPAGVGRERALACLTANLRKAAQAFAALRIGVLCEAVNPLDAPGYLVNTPAQLEALLRDVDHPNVWALYDLYHMARQKLDLVAGIESLAARIGHVQFADCPGRGEPGSGAIAFAPILQALQKVGYAGWLGAEYHPGGATVDSLGWLLVWRSLE